jgi:hypothetical protein
VCRGTVIWREGSTGVPRHIDTTPWSASELYRPSEVAPQLYSRCWADPVPDPLLLRKSGSAGNGTQASGPVDYRGGPRRLPFSNKLSLKGNVAVSAQCVASMRGFKEWKLAYNFILAAWLCLVTLKSLYLSLGYKIQRPIALLQVSFSLSEASIAKLPYLSAAAIPSLNAPRRDDGKNE